MQEKIKKAENSRNYSKFRVNGALEILQGAFTSRSFKPHFHDTYALILVESGIADYGYKKKEQVVRDNRLLVLNPYEVHTGRSLGEGVWNFRSMYIPQDLVRANFQVNNDKLPVFVNNIIKKTNFLSRYQLLHSKLMENEITIEEESELALLLNELMTLAGLDIKKEDSDNYSIVCKRMRDYIHEYYDENIQLDDLMSISGFSRFHLIKIFRERYGLPPHQYLNNLRIEKAKQLLINGMMATDVAFSVGFFDQSHFIRHFKKIVGVTPKAYAR